MGLIGFDLCKRFQVWRRTSSLADTSRARRLLGYESTQRVAGDLRGWILHMLLGDSY